MTPNDIPLIGYADRLSAGPGETVEFKVSSRSGQPFEARLVRVLCGDPNPDGPGIKEVPVPSGFEGSWPSHPKDAHLGSFARVPGARPEGGAMTVVATVWPTLPAREGQGIVSWLAGERRPRPDARRRARNGAQGRPAGRAGPALEVAVGKPLRSRAWYRVWGSVDPDSGMMTVGQAPLDETPVVDDAGTARRQAGALSPAGAGPGLFIAALGGDPVGGRFNGKIERPYIVGSGPGAARLAAPRRAGPRLPGHRRLGLLMRDCKPAGGRRRTERLARRAGSTSPPAP